ncbi:MAG: response regulator transcription factor [Bacteroidales bacterium]|jgi:DNA-binding response OmpR family regulator|nr:response regulator transcription factor [Bacteroidales bacterium]
MKDKKTKILLVEDDTNLGFLLFEFLESNGFDVKLYRDGISGLNGFKSSEFDFCILDVMLPQMDGFTLAGQIRAINKRIPVIFLTARSLKEDKVKGFGIGIDDYITKPFDEDELLLRIRSILNRVNNVVVEDTKLEYVLGNIVFDVQNQVLKINNESRRLTTKESKVLAMLARSQDKIVNREEIMKEVWGETDYFIGRSLDVFISKIRRHLHDEPRIKIETIPTVGVILSITE